MDPIVYNPQSSPAPDPDQSSSAADPEALNPTTPQAQPVPPTGSATAAYDWSSQATAPATPTEPWSQAPAMPVDSMPTTPDWSAPSTASTTENPAASTDWSSPNTAIPETPAQPTDWANSSARPGLSNLGVAPAMPAQRPAWANPPTQPTTAEVAQPTFSAYSSAPMTPAQPEIPAGAAPLQPGMPDQSPAALVQPAPASTAPFGRPSISGPFAGSLPGNQLTSYNSRTSRASTRRRLFMITGGSVLTVAVAATAVFGFVLPNRPSAAWSTGLNRSGKALNELVNTATEKSTLESYKRSRVTASVSGNFGGVDLSGSFDSKFDMSSGVGGISVVGKQAGQPDQNYSLKFIGQLAKDHLYPNVYLQLSGYKSLGLESLIPGIDAYDGKWIGIDDSFYSSLHLDPSTTSNKNTLTSDDVAELSKAAMSVTSDYVFSTNPKKAVFELKKTIGKEKVDSISAYHYVVGLNKTNFGSYCDALVNKVTAAPAYKKIPGISSTTVDSDKATAKKDCRSLVVNVKDSDSFDLWVDAKYKLIYKIRFTDTTSPGAYVDVGQHYNGGDTVILFVHANDPTSKTDINFVLTTNTKTNATAVDFTAVNSSDSPYKYKVSAKAEPYTGTIDTTAPAGSVKIQDVLNQLGLGSLVSGAAGAVNTGSASSSPLSSQLTKADDVVRKTDINSLHAEIEAAYATGTGIYPKLTDVNSPAWQAKNMPGLDKKAFTPPHSSATTLAATASSSQYGYTATGCDSTGCTGYTLTAILADGSKYIKTALNQ